MTTQMQQTMMAAPLEVPSDERCDRCGAPSKLEVVLVAGGRLTFCGHHANKYGERLLQIAVGTRIESGFTWNTAEPIRVG